MTRKFKTLGLVLASVFALSALGASAASAAEFHSSSAPVTVSGTQSTSHVFTTNAGTVTCKVANFSGTSASTTTTTVTLTPEYSNCTVFGFIGIEIHENGCGYDFLASGTTQVECPGSSEIDITAPGCTITVPAQHLATGMTYTTVGTSPNRHITAHTNISGIHYNECGTTRTNGTYKGSTTVKAASGEIWYT